MTTLTLPAVNTFDLLHDLEDAHPKGIQLVLQVSKYAESPAPSYYTDATVNVTAVKGKVDSALVKKIAKTHTPPSPKPCLAEQIGDLTKQVADLAAQVAALQGSTA